MSNLKYRMYFFVPYNLSEIQKGIQAGHCALEYAREHGASREYKDFIKNDKTWIILNGGTTRDVDMSIDHSMITEEGEWDCGTMNIVFNSVKNANIKCSYFREPDLNFALTSFCFLVDERVWNLKKYPNYEDDETILLSYNEWIEKIGGHQNAFLRELLKDKRLA